MEGRAEVDDRNSELAEGAGAATLANSQMRVIESCESALGGEVSGHEVCGWAEWRGPSPKLKGSSK